jgi:hypothetical protein
VEKHTIGVADFMLVMVSTIECDSYDVIGVRHPFSGKDLGISTRMQAASLRPCVYLSVMSFTARCEVEAV